MLSNIIIPPLETELKKSALSFDNLVAFHNRFEKRFDLVN